MKIRRGFVSNSSTSSFVVTNASTVGECAYTMMWILKSDYNNFKWKLPEGFDKAFKWLEENLEYDEPIKIPWGINYETYIWKNRIGICVDTNNNHSWWEYMDTIGVNEDWKYDNVSGFIKGFFEDEDEETRPTFNDNYGNKFLNLLTMEKE